MSKRINPYDQSLKLVVKYYPRVFVSLLNLGEKVEIAVENPEINLPEKRADYVLRLTTEDGQEGYIIFEFQFIGSTDALKSCFIKCALLHEHTSLPVIGVIIYLMKRGCQQVYDICFQGCRNQYHFEIIRLWEYREEIESGKLKELAPFLILFTDEPVEEVLNREKKLIMQVEDEKKRANLLSIAMTLAAHRFKGAWVKEYFKEEIKMVKSADIIQEWIEEGIEKGRKEGLQQGIQQGLQQGIQQGLQQGIQQGLQQGIQQGIRGGLLDAISFGLELRFGVDGLKLYERIGQIDSVEKLKAIKEAIRIAKDIKEIESLL
ncbi:MAG: hypothetical protein K6U11_13010 [bacterium]|nr:hypothetical protein [bacterium]